MQEQAATQETADPTTVPTADGGTFDVTAMLAAIRELSDKERADAVMQEEPVSQEAQQAINTLPVLPNADNTDPSAMGVEQSDADYAAQFEAEFEKQQDLQDAEAASNATRSDANAPKNEAQMVTDLDNLPDYEDSAGRTEEAQVQTEFEKAQARQEAAAAEMKAIIAGAQARRAARNDGAEPETMDMFAQTQAAQEAAAAESKKLIEEARAYNHAKAVDTIHEKDFTATRSGNAWS